MFGCMEVKAVLTHIQSLNPTQFAFHLKMFCRFGLQLIAKSGLVSKCEMAFLKQYITRSEDTAECYKSGYSSFTFNQSSSMKQSFKLSQSCRIHVNYHSSHSLHRGVSFCIVNHRLVCICSRRHLQPTCLGRTAGLPQRYYVYSSRRFAMA